MGKKKLNFGFFLFFQLLRCVQMCVVRAWLYTDSLGLVPSRLGVWSFQLLPQGGSWKALRYDRRGTFSSFVFAGLNNNLHGVSLLSVFFHKSAFRQQLRDRRSLPEFSVVVINQRTVCNIREYVVLKVHQSGHCLQPTQLCTWPG